jgi:transposase
MDRHGLTDEHWALIEHLFPKRAETGRPPKDHRTMLDGILWILRTGAPWRDLPEGRFGPWETVYCRFNQWRANGLWDRIAEHLQAKLDRDGLLDRDLWCVDGSVIRAHRSAAGAGEGGRVLRWSRWRPVAGAR